MGDVYFYHLTETPLEKALPTLLTRAREREWRIELRTSSDTRAQWLDKMLWDGGDGEFLPHGLAGGPHDDDQPILITTQSSEELKLDCVMCVDQSVMSASEIETLQRACIIFDGVDPNSVQKAREQWSKLTADGCAAQYWAQEGGRWIKKAESQGQ